MPRDLVIINTANYNGGNKYTYRFPSGIKMENTKLSLYSLSMYNSTYNISSDLRNNTFSINWLGTVYNFTIPDGYYSIPDLNFYLQQQMLLNNLYLTVNNGGQNVFFVELVVNTVRYKAQLNCYYIPTSANASLLGYTKPGSASWSYPSSNETPTISFCSGLLTLLGFKDGLISYPSVAQATNYTKVSDTYPVLSPIFNYIITCNLVESKFNNVPNILCQVPINASFGNLISLNNSQSQQINVRKGTYNEIVIQLWDQNYDILRMNDPEMILTLLIDSEE